MRRGLRTETEKGRGKMGGGREDSGGEHEVVRTRMRKGRTKTLEWRERK